MHRKLMVTGAVPISALLLASLLVAGCGSSGSSTSTETTAAIAKAEFVKEGNAICVAGEKAQEAEAEAFFNSKGLKNRNEQPTKAQKDELAETVFVPNIQKQIDSVKALGAPSGEEQQVNSALEASQQALNKVKANPEQFFANESVFHAAGQQLHALGLTKCAENT